MNLVRKGDVKALGKLLDSSWDTETDATETVSEGAKEEEGQKVSVQDRRHVCIHNI